jgi:hypothetical protein
MNLEDKSGLAEVVAFVEKRLGNWDTSLLDSFKINPRPVRKKPKSGSVSPPERVKPRSRQFKHQWKLTAGVNMNLNYPFTIDLAVGSCPAANTRGWDYVWQKTVFANVEELLVFAIGGVLFEFLRGTNQIPVSLYGKRRSVPGYNKCGLEWLTSWRNRLIDRRALVMATRRKLAS